MKVIYFMVTSMLFFASCAQVVPLPDETYTQKLKSRDVKESLPVYTPNRVENQTLHNEDVTLVQEGDLNIYNIEVDKNLYDAYRNYMNGNGDEALKAINLYSSLSKESKQLWQGAYLKIQILLMMGLGEDAYKELPQCEKYEKLAFSSNLNTRALRAELHFWNQDYKSAKKDASEVLQTIGAWELPVSYDGPPANMPRLANIVTAQLRSYTILAALYNLQEDYENAYYYANEAEKRYNAIHYVSNHWLYGKFVNVHLDSYYGRANNLALLASSELALGKSQVIVDAHFKEAVGFFKMIGYKKGAVTALALKARVYNKKQQYAQAYKVCSKAIKLAVKNDFLDLAWQIGALRGEALLKLGRKEEAEVAFRKANDSINILSGALSSDTAKTNFGVGKDEVAYRLLEFDIDKKDYVQLFRDLESSRSRSFVDMLSDRTLSLSHNNRLLQSIMKLDKKIRKQRLINSAKSDAQSRKIFRTMLDQREQLAKELFKEDSKLFSAVSIYASTLQETQDKLKLGEEILYFLHLHKTDRVQYMRIQKERVSLDSLAISYADVEKYLLDISNVLGVNPADTSRGLHHIKLATLNTGRLKEIGNIDNFIKELQQKLEVDKLFTTSKTYMVQSGITHFIPWGMLDTQHNIANLVNASWLNHAPLQRKSMQDIVIVANPAFHGELTQLEGALEEGKSIAQMYKTTLLSGINANRKNLYTKLQTPTKILHLATHSLFIKDKPLESSIYLSGESGAYALSAKEIYEHPLNANLVVLSSCESGLGQSTNGDDMLGLSRSFFLGTTKSILSSLWEVDDAGTKEFMVNFYAYAKDGNYSYAYQKTREILKAKGYSPAVYGAFVLSGVNED